MLLSRKLQYILKLSIVFLVPAVLLRQKPQPISELLRRYHKQSEVQFTERKEKLLDASGSGLHTYQKESNIIF